MRITAVLLLVFPYLTLVAQERNLSKKNLPAEMADYLKTHYPEVGKMAYYQRRQNDTLFYEAEFHLRKVEYNLTFQENGALYEIEKEITFQEIPDTIQPLIRHSLESQFQWFKIKKVQELNPQQDLQYEINLKGKTKGDTDYYDVYFNREGKLISMQEIELKSINTRF